jgi:hypothetical protein
VDNEGRWLTYGELATIRGTKRASAVKLAQRERWPRRAGNDRSQTVRVLVPEQWLVSARDQPAEPQDKAEGMPEGFAALLSAANAQVSEANKRADVAMALADRLTVALGAVEGRAERAEAARLVAQERLAELERAEPARKALLIALSRGSRSCQQV